jgi:hypothetical protein
MRHSPQLLHQLRVAWTVDVIDGISQRTARIQRLALDVDPAIAQDVINRP